MTLQTGQVLNNRYRIVKLLGQGGFGAVYRAWDINFELPCALKENIEVSSSAQRQFLREARILHMLRHPNLPLVKDYFFIPDQGQYLVMDYVEGEDLQVLIEQKANPFAENEVIQWVSEVCQALDYMHTQSPPVIHRDIKPANIKITPKGNAILVDFGISKVYDPNVPTTLGAQAVSPGFSPFEQYGHAATDARTDIYALGATAYKLLTSQTPPESISRLTGVELIMPALLNPKISPHVEQAIMRAVQLSPGDRFSSALEFRQALLQKGEPLHTFTDMAAATSVVNVAPATVVVEEQLLEKPDPISFDPRKKQDPKHLAIKPKKTKKAFLRAALLLLIGLGLFAGAFFLWQGFLSERFPVAPLPEEKEPVINISGEWRGFVEEIGGEHRNFEIFIWFEHDPDIEEVGCHMEVVLEPEVVEGRPCGGKFTGREIRIVDEKDQTYWGVLEGERFVGETAWGCFDCEPWGVFELWR